MNNCKHDTEYPVKQPNGSIYCLSCGHKLADTTFVGIEPEIIPVHRSNWSKESLTKALDERAKPEYLNLDKLTTVNGLISPYSEASTDSSNSPTEATQERKDIP